MNAPQTSPLDGPAWDIDSEYPGFTSDAFARDRRAVDDAIAEMVRETQGALAGGATGEIAPALRRIGAARRRALLLTQNLETYASCALSIDAADPAARAAHADLQALAARVDEAAKPFSLRLARCDEATLDAYLADPEAAPEAFFWRQARALGDTLLSSAEEQLIAGLGVHGHTAWGALYNALSGSLRCHLRRPGGAVEEVGLAEAQARIRGPEEGERRAAWQAIQDAWRGQEETAAAILNALSGWRLDLVKRRSHTRAVDVLTEPLHAARIGRGTLDAMMGAARGSAELPRQALRAMAKVMGKERLDPWDLLAPLPERAAPGARPLRSYREALDVVAAAFGAVDPSMADFVTMMDRRGWIEGRVLPRKRQGAYCTTFARSATPRVFMTYMGSLQDVSTLAHELGHAYHAWVMRDLPPVLHEYPTTLAETASLFAEAALGDHLARGAATPAARFEVAWAEAADAASLLLNIPARFAFEARLHEARRDRHLAPDDLSALMEEAWRASYGDSLSAMDRLFWASKLHFHMSEVSFYNFPYTFGYLFSLGLVARREELGGGFVDAYTAILRDSGRMTAEELTRKHLGEDLTAPAFWEKSLGVVRGKVERFLALVG